MRFAKQLCSTRFLPQRRQPSDEHDVKVVDTDGWGRRTLAAAVAGKRVRRPACLANLLLAQLAVKVNISNIDVIEPWDPTIGRQPLSDWQLEPPSAWPGCRHAKHQRMKHKVFPSARRFVVACALPLPGFFASVFWRSIW